MQSRLAAAAMGTSPGTAALAQEAPQDPLVRFGSYCHGAEALDAAAFGLPLPEALVLDPQQRLLLEAAAEALAGAGGRLGGALTAVGAARDRQVQSYGFSAGPPLRS